VLTPTTNGLPSQPFPTMGLCVVLPHKCEWNRLSIVASEVRSSHLHTDRRQHVAATNLCVYVMAHEVLYH
jgi:hypothetical protein